MDTFFDSASQILAYRGTRELKGVRPLYLVYWTYSKFYRRNSGDFLLAGSLENSLTSYHLLFRYPLW